MAQKTLGEISSDLQLGAGVLGGLAVVQFGSSFIDGIVNSVTSSGGLAKFSFVANLLVDAAAVYLAFAQMSKSKSPFSYGLWVGIGSGFVLRGARDIGALVGFSLPKLGVTF